MNSLQHELKIEPRYFEQVLLGNKTFEIRKNDRNFKAGDLVILKEFTSIYSRYTGRTITFVIGYVCDYEQRANYVVFSLLTHSVL